MLGHIRRSVNTRSPSFEGTLTIDGNAPNLPGGTTAKFQMRAVGSSTLKVDTAAVIDSLVTGDWHYDPAAADVDTAGMYLGWLHLTLPGGTTQDSPEQLIEFYAHSDAVHNYISAGELKDSLGIKAGYADSDLEGAVAAASRAIDAYCRRVFWLGATSTEIRTYTPVSDSYVLIDDLAVATEIKNQGTIITAGTDFALTPYNAAANGEPYQVLRSIGTYPWPRNIAGGVTVKGQFGWPAVPAQVKSAAKILGARLLTRARSATFGVVGLDFDGAAVRISTTDPDLALMLGPLRRSGMIE